jgi:hypothetical protein
MALQIVQKSLMEYKALKVSAGGVTLVQTAGFGGGRAHGFEEIVCILKTPDARLCVQVGEKVFTVQTKPGTPAHDEAIAALLDGVRNSADGS